MTLDYIGGQQRLNEGNKWDFYFYCNIKGPSMQWVINETGYHAILPIDFDTVYRDSSLPNLNYTTTLLSSRTVNRVHHLDAILIVSVEDNITVNVDCVSDSGGSDSSSNREISANQLKQAQSPYNKVQMFLVWNKTVVQGTNISTKCFMCGVDFSHQIWETSNNDILKLNTELPLGSEFSRVSADNNFLRLQAIYIAQSPKQLVSIIFVTDSSVAKVSCKAGNIFLSSDQLQNIPSDTTDSTISNDTGNTTSQSKGNDHFDTKLLCVN